MYVIEGNAPSGEGLNYLFNKFIGADDRLFRAKCYIGNSTTAIGTDRIASINVDFDFTNGNAFDIGCFSCAKLEITFKHNVVVNKYNYIRPFVELRTYDSYGSEVWIPVPLGVFCVYDITSEYLSKKIVAYDKAYILDETKLSKCSDYPDFPCTISDFINFINTTKSLSKERSRLGITPNAIIVDPELAAYPSFKIANLDDGLTIRTFLGYLAGMEGKNAYIDRDGKIQFIKFTNKTDKVYSASEFGNYSEEDYDMYINRLECTTNWRDDLDEDGALDEDTYEIVLNSGPETNSDVYEFFNPMMTQSILDTIYNNSGLNGLKYKPVSLRLKGDPRIEVSDVLTFTKRVRNANTENVSDYTEANISIPVMRLNIRISSGCMCDIQSTADKERKRGFYMSGSLADQLNAMKKKVDAVESKVDDANNKADDAFSKWEDTDGKVTQMKGEIEANTIVANEVVAARGTFNELSARFADIDHLVANKAEIENLYATNAEIDNLKANKADIELLNATVANIEEAYVTKLYADDAYITKLAAEEAYIGKAEIDHLEAEVIEAALIEAQKIVTEELDAFKITADNIEAGSITADKIAANSISGNHIQGHTISGDHIMGKTITGNLIAGQTITGNHIVGNSITADKLDANSIKTDILDAYEISADRITSGYINSDLIEAGAITADKIASNILDSEHIMAGSIVSSHISAHAINADKIAAGSIESTHISTTGLDAQVIKTGKLTADRIDTTDLVAENVTAGAINAAWGSITDGALNSAAIGNIAADKIVVDSLFANKVIDASVITADKIKTGNLNLSEGLTIGNPNLKAEGSPGGILMEERRITIREPYSSNILDKTERGNIRVQIGQYSESINGSVENNYGLLVMGYKRDSSGNLVYENGKPIYDWIFDSDRGLNVEMGLQSKSITADKIVDKGITADQLANGAIGDDQIDDSIFQEGTKFSGCFIDKLNSVDITASNITADCIKVEHLLGKVSFETLDEDLSNIFMYDGTNTVINGNRIWTDTIYSSKLILDDELSVINDEGVTTFAVDTKGNLVLAGNISSNGAVTDAAIDNYGIGFLITKEGNANFKGININRSGTIDLELAGLTRDIAAAGYPALWVGTNKDGRLNAPFQVDTIGNLTANRIQSGDIYTTSSSRIGIGGGDYSTPNTYMTSTGIFINSGEYSLTRDGSLTVENIKLSNGDFILKGDKLFASGFSTEYNDTNSKSEITPSGLAMQYNLNMGMVYMDSTGRINITKNLPLHSNIDNSSIQLNEYDVIIGEAYIEDDGSNGQYVNTYKNVNTMVTGDVAARSFSFINDVRNYIPNDEGERELRYQFIVENGCLNIY